MAGINRVGYVQFHHICEALKTHREDIQKTCRKKRDAIAYIVAKTQKPCPETTFEEACKAVEISFEFASPRENLKDSSANNRRVMISAIVSLYEKFGEPIPVDMRQLFERSFGRPYREPVTGTPVSKVVQSATIPVANVKR